MAGYHGWALQSLIGACVPFIICSEMCLTCVELYCKMGMWTGELWWKHRRMFSYASRIDPLVEWINEVEYDCLSVGIVCDVVECIDYGLICQAMQIEVIVKCLSESQSGIISLRPTIFKL